MKVSLILLVLIGIFFSCQQKKHYQESPEIDLVKKLNDSSIKGDWTTFRSLFHDTASVYINNWYHQRLSPDQFVENFKNHLTNVSDFKLDPNTVYEMVLTSDGQHWVHLWTELTYVLKDGKEVRTVDHAAFRVENNKIVFLAAILDSLPRYLAEQALQEGSFISVFTITVKLKPGITLQQYKEFYVTKVIPGYEKLVPGLNGYLVQAIRGENKSSLGAMWVFKTEKERDQYFNDDGTPTEAGKELQNKMMPMFDELAKLGTSTTKFTDWVVQ